VVVQDALLLEHATHIAGLGSAAQNAIIHREDAQTKQLEARNTIMVYAVQTVYAHTHHAQMIAQAGRKDVQALITIMSRYAAIMMLTHAWNGTQEGIAVQIHAIQIIIVVTAIQRYA
jgi:hypothetical protein